MVDLGSRIIHVHVYCALVAKEWIETEECVLGTVQMRMSTACGSIG